MHGTSNMLIGSVTSLACVSAAQNRGKCEYLSSAEALYIFVYISINVQLYFPFAKECAQCLSCRLCTIVCKYNICYAKILTPKSTLSQINIRRGDGNKCSVLLLHYTEAFHAILQRRLCTPPSAHIFFISYSPFTSVWNIVFSSKALFSSLNA